MPEEVKPAEGMRFVTVLKEPEEITDAENKTIGKLKTQLDKLKMERREADAAHQVVCEAHYKAQIGRENTKKAIQAQVDAIQMKTIEVPE